MGAQAALVGLISALLGVSLSNLFVALIDNRRRYTRQLDLVYAVHAEISAGLGAGLKQLAPEEKAYALADETPFQTPDQTDFVFDSIKSDISLLPTDVIHSVVQYYKYATQSNLMTADLRDPVFLKQSIEEKRKFVGALLDVVEQQYTAATKALSDLDDYALSRGLQIINKHKLQNAKVGLP